MRAAILSNVCWNNGCNVARVTRISASTWKKCRPVVNARPSLRTFSTRGCRRRLRPNRPVLKSKCTLCRIALLKGREGAGVVKKDAFTGTKLGKSCKWRKHARWRAGTKMCGSCVPTLDVISFLKRLDRSLMIGEGWEREEGKERRKVRFITFKRRT